MRHGKKLKCYVEKGRIAGSRETSEEPMISVQPDASFIKPLKKVITYPGSFIAVDCSTRTLKRANNWGVYLMRASCVTVKKRQVDWTYSERICTVIGDARIRRSYLQDFRIELESQVASNALKEAVFNPHHVHDDVRSMYLLLDGGGYFGGEHKFRVSLYEECEKRGINLLAISKNSPSLHDEKGRDLIATTYMLSPYAVWVYHPVRKADKERSLYGDITIVKLCADCSNVFRCDVMDYLTKNDIVELLSPLTAFSEDPRCLGYPISLYLAHEFSGPSDSMLLSYHDQAEEKLREAELLDSLRVEERSCSFADEIHGLKHAYDWGGGMTSTESIGFVCGTKGDSVSFLVNKDVNLSFGQIVRIDSNERDFYARVVNSESSSTLETIEQLREAEGKEAFGPYSAYRSVAAILFLEKSREKLRSPTINPN